MSIALSDWKASALRHPHRGHRVAYFEAGQGEPLLLLHGFPTSSFDYQELWQPLAERFRVIAFDMIGYGLSDKPVDYDYRVVDQADIAQELCAALGVSSCAVLAQDVGDSVCQELLARHIDGQGGLRLRRVMLLNGGLFPEQHRETDFQTALHGPDGAAMAALVTKDAFLAGLRGMFGPDTHPDEVTMDALWELLSRADGVARWPQTIRYIEDRRTHRERWVGALIHSPIPIRLIVGARDPVSGRHMAEHYQKLIPDADVRILDDVGHFPQIEVPETILEEALRFFASQ